MSPADLILWIIEISLRTAKGQVFSQTNALYFYHKLPINEDKKFLNNGRFYAYLDRHPECKFVYTKTQDYMFLLKPHCSMKGSLQISVYGPLEKEYSKAVSKERTEIDKEIFQVLYAQARKSACIPENAISGWHNTPELSTRIEEGQRTPTVGE